MTGAPLIVLAAGGTGGHVFPAEALAEELLSRKCRLALVTDRRGGAYGGSLGTIEVHHIAAGGIAGKNILALMRSIPGLALGTLQARRLLSRMGPDAVVGFGGYASAPTMLAAAFAGFRTAIHEQNAVLGRANRLLAQRVQRIATSFEESRAVPESALSKVVHTGMPVRPAVRALRDRAYTAPDRRGEIRLLVLGGSQGARILSQVVPEALALLDEATRGRVRLAQQCRPEDLDAVRNRYSEIGIAAELATFFKDAPERLADAHLLIARAGASTVAEMTAVGRPAILVPYRYAVDDHQAVNAHAVDDAGAGWLLPEDDFTPDTLAARLRSLLQMPAALENAAACARRAGRPDAAGLLADMVMDMLAGNGMGGGGQPESRRQAA